MPPECKVEGFTRFFSSCVSVARSARFFFVCVCRSLLFRVRVSLAPIGDFARDVTRDCYENATRPLQGVAFPGDCRRDGAGDEGSAGDYRDEGWWRSML